LQRSKRYIDWSLPDPNGRPLAEVRATRDHIRQNVTALLAELDRQFTAATPSGPP